MAAITGGNTLVGMTIALVAMVVVLIALFTSAFDMGGLLSLSLVDIAGRGGDVEVSESDEEFEVLDPDMTQQRLGFVDYPVVDIPDDAISVFSPGSVEEERGFSEDEIARRCAHISIPFNRDRCMRAERDCSTEIASEDEHWQCLSRHDFWIGKPVAYLAK